MNRSRKTILLVSALASLSAGISACGGDARVSTAEYIGIDAAKTAALSDAGIPSGQAEFSSAGLDSRNGTFYYEVNFTGNGAEYQYDIDAITGTVIEAIRLDPAAAESGSPSPEESSSSVPETASSPSGSGGASGSAGETAPTTAVPSSGAESSGPAVSGALSEDQARSAALSHAGVKESDLLSMESKKDTDHGREIYEIRFRCADGTEYSYDILAEDGSVLTYDYESPSSPTAAPEGTGMLTDTQVRQAVLERVPGASPDQISLKLDEDDGRMEYEGSLIHEGMEYEFKMDAYSGSILEWEADRL